MRISADERYSGWSTYQALMPRALQAKILLNGQALQHVIVADEELGEVLVFAVDANGIPQVNGDDLRREWRRGKVEIIMPAAEAA